jgi:polyphosphate glucokinase
LGIDVGGSSIKAALVDVGKGELVSERSHVATPADFAVDAVLDAIVELARAHADLDPGAGVAIGVGFPAAVVRGVVASPPTAHEFAGWVGRDLSSALRERIGRRVTVANDADVAGLAEMRFGAGRGRTGVVVILTLGTGIGSALFNDGVLVANTELGKLYLEDADEVAELSVASRLRTEEGLSWEVWTRRLETYLRHVDRLFTPDLIIVGGGISADADHFLPGIEIRSDLRAARLRNDAGIVGAATAAALVSGTSE